MVFDQGKEALQSIVEAGKLPLWRLDTGGVVKCVDDGPAYGTDRQARGK